jgi:hypothetical protein
MRGRVLACPISSITKQPVFSGRLDFQIVAADNIYNVLGNEREQREGRMSQMPVPSPVLMPRILAAGSCLPSRSLLDCPRVGAEHKTCDLTKTFRQLCFMLWQSSVTQGWGAAVVKSVPASCRETSPVILRRPMPISSLNTTPLTGGALRYVDAVCTRTGCNRGVNKVPPPYREVSMSPSASCRMNTRGRLEASSSQPAVIHCAPVDKHKKELA